MSADYTAWPTTTNVQERLTEAGITLRQGTSSDRITEAINGVVKEIARETLRTFIATSETRYFDGNGLPEIEVDEYISITTVTFVGNDLTAGLAVTVFEVEEENKPKTRLRMYRGQFPVVGYLDRFSKGVGNIQIAASWGYGATIPADLWEAALNQMAACAAELSLFRGELGGNVLEIQEGDTRYKFGASNLGQGTSISETYTAMLKKYRRPTQNRVQALRPPMI